MSTRVVLAWQAMPKFKVWNPEIENLSDASEIEHDEAEEAAEEYMQNNSPNPDENDHLSLIVMDEDGSCFAVDVEIEWEQDYQCDERPQHHGFTVIVKRETGREDDVYSWKDDDGTIGASFSSFDAAEADGRRRRHAKAQGCE